MHDHAIVLLTGLGGECECVCVGGGWNGGGLFYSPHAESNLYDYYSHCRYNNKNNSHAGAKTAMAFTVIIDLTCNVQWQER